MIIQFTERVAGVKRPMYVDGKAITAILNRRPEPGVQVDDDDWARSVVVNKSGNGTVMFLIEEATEAAVAQWRIAIDERVLESGLTAIPAN